MTLCARFSFFRDGKEYVCSTEDWKSFSQQINISNSNLANISPLPAPFSHSPPSYLSSLCVPDLMLCRKVQRLIRLVRITYSIILQSTFVRLFVYNQSNGVIFFSFGFVLKTHSPHSLQKHKHTQHTCMCTLSRLMLCVWSTKTTYGMEWNGTERVAMASIKC